MNIKKIIKERIHRSYKGEWAYYSPELGYSAFLGTKKRRTAFKRAFALARSYYEDIFSLDNMDRWVHDSTNWEILVSGSREEGETHYYPLWIKSGRCLIIAYPADGESYVETILFDER